MSTDPLSRIAQRIADAKEAVDREFAPLVRNHLVQLFRMAHAVEPDLTGMVAGMGVASPTGTYIREDGETQQASDWRFLGGSKAKHPTTEAWLAEVDAYSDRLCRHDEHDLPYVRDITLDDLETPTTRKAAFKTRRRR